MVIFKKFYCILNPHQLEMQEKGFSFYCNFKIEKCRNCEKHFLTIVSGDKTKLRTDLMLSALQDKYSDITLITE